MRLENDSSLGTWQASCLESELTSAQQLYQTMEIRSCGQSGHQAMARGVRALDPDATLQPL